MTTWSAISPFVALGVFLIAYVFIATEKVDKVLDEFRSTGASLISTNLSNEQEAHLRDFFAEAEA